MNMKAWMPLHPGLHSRMFVGSIVVGDQMQIHFWRSFRINPFKKPDKLLVPMPRHAVANDSSVESYHRSKEGRSAVPFVIVRHRAATAFL